MSRICLININVRHKFTGYVNNTYGGFGMTFRNSQKHNYTVKIINCNRVTFYHGHLGN